MKTSKGLGAARTAQILSAILVICTILASLLFVVWTDAKCHQSKNCPEQHQTNYEPNSIDYRQVLSGFWRWTMNDPVSFYTFCLAIFTAGLVIASGIQWRYLAKADKNARDAAIAAAKAAEAASINANAVLGVELPRLELLSASWDSKMLSILDKLQEGRIVISFRNHGRTDARIVDECVTADVPQYDFMATEPRYPIFGVQTAKIGTVVAPGEDYVIWCHGRLSITKEEASAVLQSDKSLYIYGFVRYRDFLDETWRSKFCVTLDAGNEFREASSYPAYSGRSRFDIQAQSDLDI